jgi:hypothetical protein
MRRLIYFVGAFAAFESHCAFAFLAVLLGLGSVDGKGGIRARASLKSAGTRTQGVEETRGGVLTATSEASHLHNLETNDMKTINFQTEDVSALQSIYQSTDGNGWIDRAGWLTTSDLNDWFGVTASSNSGVTEIDLHNNNLAGMCLY